MASTQPTTAQPAQPPPFGDKGLENIFKNVLGMDENSSLHRAFVEFGGSSMTDLITMEETDISTLAFTDSKGNLCDVAKGHKSLVRQLIGFARWRDQDLNMPMDDNSKWESLEKVVFFAFRSGPWLRIKDLSPTSIISSRGFSSSARSPAEDFRKGIKRDPNLFDAFKNDDGWDNYKRSLEIQARAQNVSNVLDDSYVPTTNDDKELFQEQQKYMFSVFEKTLKTQNGLNILRSHHNNSDAQQVWKELCQKYVKSTRADIQAGNLMTYISSAKLGDSSWKGTTEDFIIHWENQVRKYHSLVETAEQLSPGIQKTLLMNAVAPVPELNAVKETANQLSVQTGQTLGFDEYMALLKSAATTYDKSKSSKSTFGEKYTPQASRRKVYQHEGFLTSDLEPDPQFDIDTPISVIEAYRTEHLKGSRLHGEIWAQLSQEERNDWDKFSERTKALILQSPNHQSRPRNFNSEDRQNQRTRRAHETVQRLVNVFEAIQLEQQNESEGDNDNEQVPDSGDKDVDSAEVVDKLVSYVTEGKFDETPASHIAKLMSSSHGTSPTKSAKSVRTPTRTVNMAKIVTYNVSKNLRMDGISALVDRGSNGIVSGADTRIMDKPCADSVVHIQGLDQHQVNNVPLVTAGGVVQTQHGPAIAIMHNSAHTGKGHTILSAIQLEEFGCEVDDRCIRFGGKQRIKTADGYLIPLSIRNGLPYIKMRPYSDTELDTLPHIFLTDHKRWDPSDLDHDLANEDDWFDTFQEPNEDTVDNVTDATGNYLHREVNKQFLDTFIAVNKRELRSDKDLRAELEFIDRGKDNPSNEVDTSSKKKEKTDDATTEQQDPGRKITKDPVDYEKYESNFLFVPKNLIKKTFENTTQFARMPMSDTLKKAYRSPFPACNIHRRNEPVATDTVYSDTPAIDDGATAAQIFVGTETTVADVYPMKSGKHFVNALEDNIRERGAMDKMISDRGSNEISKRVKDILRYLFIRSWQSEPHQQQQNPFERRYQDIKRKTNRMLDRSGCPPACWLLCMMYVVFVMNHTFNQGIKAVPLQRLTGSTPDISPILSFQWWEPVYYKLDDSAFPSDSPEARGRFVGIAEHVGHVMTYKILTDDTKKVIYRSNVRSALKEKSHNLRLDPIDGETVHEYVKSMLKDPPGVTEDTRDPPNSTPHDEAQSSQMPIIDYDDLVGRTFLMDKNEKGEIHRARIVEMIDDMDAQRENSNEFIRFRCKVDATGYEELLHYNDLMEHLSTDRDSEQVWKFKRIVGHEGPLRSSDPAYKGSSYNIILEWENGEITYEPLDLIAKDDPVTCALYARENDLLSTPGWKRFRQIAKRQKVLNRMLNQTKLKSFHRSRRYKYGIELPHDYNDAMRLDKLNGITKWKEAIDYEIDCMSDYEVFKDNGQKVPHDHKKIRVHLVFDVKHDGRHRARLVADGHLTDVPAESVYSGVVSLRGLRMITFLAELNKLELWSTDISSAYLEAFTQEKIYIVAGPEFGELEGHILIIHRALYGLRTSGVRWHERLATCLQAEGFFPCKAEPDIWMRKNGDVYEYIGVYVDDLAFALKDPQTFIDTLRNKYKFKIKEAGSIEFHLGINFLRDSDGTLRIEPKKFLERLSQTYERHFGCKPNAKPSSPLEKGDHPEVDTSELCTPEDTSKYQSLIGSLQWLISLGRFDVATAVMSLSSFRAAPRVGHLERAKRVCCYAIGLKHAAIRFRVKEPDFSSIPIPDYDWSYSVYGNPQEDIPKDAPEPLGNYVQLSHFVDANLMHCLLTGRSVTGVLHFMNQTPMDWFTKKQSTAETATFGSEFIAARTAIEQIIDIRNTLRYLGVPIRQYSYLFGDNQTVVNSATQPHGKLHKRHTMLSFHRVREAIASKMVIFTHIPGAINPADILSKHWGYSQVWPMLRVLLCYFGDTIKTLEELSG